MSHELDSGIAEGAAATGFKPHRIDPVSETAERFLRAISERIPVKGIDELHLFSPLRQGAVETGIAVIAAHGGVEAVRHTVYTARYTHVIKGPDRGKWQFGVVEEADAPLVKVEEVVRGVQRRTGEEAPVARYDADGLMHILRIQPEVENGS